MAPKARVHDPGPDADLLKLGRVAEMRAPLVSIGGAGTFDGVFLTGILASLLA